MAKSKRKDGKPYTETARFKRLAKEYLENDFEQFGPRIPDYKPKKK